MIFLNFHEMKLVSYQKKINDFCIIDPTIDTYKILTPNYMQTQEIRNILDLIVLSTKEQVIIPKDKQKQFLLGEEAPANLYDIQNLKEAISLLITEMNSIAVKYLSDHFLELFESGETKNLNEDVIFSINDVYNMSENQKETENKQIFELMKSQEEHEIVIHFIIGQKGEFIKETIEYVMENLDDDIVAHELPRMQ